MLPVRLSIKNPTVQPQNTVGLRGVSLCHVVILLSMSLRDLLGLHPSSPELAQHLILLSTQTPIPQIKSYSDAVYFNYFSIGLSLLFSPENGYKPTNGLKLHELDNDKLVLESIYIYNVPPRNPRSKGTSSHTSETAYSTYPDFPLALVLIADIRDKDGTPIPRPSKLNVLADTSGKDFVQALGEPDRKGGGAGPSSGSIGIWCEWSKDGVMVEFGGDEAKGPQAWERGKDAVWKIITIFSPTI
jgi:hypothetical protein